jgi:hypothetical protein
MNLDEILKLVDKMEEESKAIKSEMFKLCWYMRGGVTLDEMYQIDIADRELIGHLIAKNLETTKETRLPFF